MEGVLIRPSGTFSNSFHDHYGWCGPSWCDRIGAARIQTICHSHHNQRYDRQRSVHLNGSHVSCGSTRRSVRLSVAGATGKCYCRFQHVGLQSDEWEHSVNCCWKQRKWWNIQMSTEKAASADISTFPFTISLNRRLYVSVGNSSFSKFTKTKATDESDGQRSAYCTGGLWSHRQNNAMQAFGWVWLA